MKLDTAQGTVILGNTPRQVYPVGWLNSDVASFTTPHHLQQGYGWYVRA